MWKVFKCSIKIIEVFTNSGLTYHYFKLLRDMWDDMVLNKIELDVSLFLR